LSEEAEEEKSREDLRPAKAFAREKFRHEGTASVLPCPGTIGETSVMDEVKEGSAATRIGLPEPSVVPPDPGLVVPLQKPFLEPMHTMFAGPRGLRAGWSLLLYVVMWRGLRMFLGVLLDDLEPHVTIKVWLDLITELGSFVVVAIPAVVMGWIERRPFGEYGLPRRGAFGKSFWVGMVWGIVAITALMLAIGGVGDFSLGGVALHGQRVLKFAAFWGMYFVIVGFFEEFLLRGYTQFTLTQGIGFWPAALVLSTVFAALHLGNPGETWIGLLAVAAIGLFLCLTLRRTGNLWFAVGFHAAWDWGESYLYSVPDSGGMVTGHLMRSSFHGSRWITGGSVGPEGSVLVFVVIALTWLAFDRMYPEVKYRD
jgi:CAAX protease family protein